MLLQAAANYTVETYVMENDDQCPAAHLCHHFIKGDIKNFDDVYAFGKNLDAITIEIENVNTEALEKLQSEGVKVYPHPSVLKIIRNKILQKEYYKKHEIPTPEYKVTANLAELKESESFLPAVHKIGEGGYDGRGVQLLKTKEDISKGFDAPSVLEKMVTIEKEIALMVAVNDKGESAIYPPVEMIFNQRSQPAGFPIMPCPAG